MAVHTICFLRCPQYVVPTYPQAPAFGLRDEPFALYPSSAICCGTLGKRVEYVCA